MPGFFSPNAPQHDHSFGIADLIEVKPGRFCGFFEKEKDMAGTTDRERDIQQQEGPIGSKACARAEICLVSAAGCVAVCPGDGPCTAHSFSSTSADTRRPVKSP